MNTAPPAAADQLSDIVQPNVLDIRMVAALAGDRTLNAREQDILEKVQAEHGERLYADILYTLTHRNFSPKHAKQLWADILSHRQALRKLLGRDPGVSLTTHDYFVNVTGMMKSVAIIEETKMASLTNVATRDGLTGLVDHATFKFKLKDEIERQTRYGVPLSLVMFDIDFFKKINDTFGHAEGDIVLKQVADLLKAQVRRMDTAARYGGEEFAVILPEVDIADAETFAERLRQTVQFTFADTPYKTTISVGVAMLNTAVNESADSLTRRSDKLLYKAKHAGRNKVCAETDTTPTPSPASVALKKPTQGSLF